jgi:hypothetical protein
MFGIILIGIESWGHGLDLCLKPQCEIAEDNLRLRYLVIEEKLH